MEATLPFWKLAKKDIQTVKLLLENSRKLNIDVNATIHIGINGFMLASKEGHKNVVKLFLEFAGKLNIDLNAKNGAGGTAFINACAWGRTDVVKLFLDYSGPIKIDLNAWDYAGQTAFDIASRFGETEVVNLLQKYRQGRSIHRFFNLRFLLSSLIRGLGFFFWWLH